MKLSPKQSMTPVVGSSSKNPPNTAQTNSVSSSATVRTIADGKKTRHEACGKAIIIGEHAVVHGARAVAIPLTEMKLILDVTASGGDPNSDTNGIEMSINNEKIARELVAVVEQAFELLDVEPFPFKIEGESKLIIGAGLGSSAALCVAILRAISNVCNQPLDYKLLAKLGNILEGRFHGKPSGLDTSVVAFEQVITYKMGESAQPLTVNQIVNSNGDASPWRFVVIDSEERASTKDMISLAEPYFIGLKGSERIKAFDELADSTISGLEIGCDQIVAKAMNRAAVMLDEAGIVTDRLGQIINIAREVGCIAAKPTGAGGGGCVLALLPTDGWREILSKLENKFGSHNINKAVLS